MKRPGYRTLLLGSRFTAPVILVGSVYVFWRWWEADTQGLTGFLALAFFLFSFRAMGEVSAYREWRADWKAMATGERPSGFWLKPKIMLMIGVAIIAAVLMILSSQPTASPETQMLAGVWVILGPTLAVLMLALRLLRLVWRRPRRRRAPVAMIADSGPMVPNLSIRACYKRLPPHCQILLRSRS